jgi:hypothetical protein
MNRLRARSRRSFRDRQGRFAAPFPFQRPVPFARRPLMRSPVRLHRSAPRNVYWSLLAFRRSIGIEAGPARSSPPRSPSMRFFRAICSTRCVARSSHVRAIFNNMSRSRGDLARLAMVRQSLAWMRYSSTFCMSGRNTESGHLVPSRPHLPRRLLPAAHDAPAGQDRPCAAPAPRTRWRLPTCGTRGYAAPHRK